MRIATLFGLAREYGVRWLGWRAAYALALRTGYFRRVLPPKPDVVTDLARRLGAAGAPGLADRWRVDSRRFFLPATAALDLPPVARKAVVARADAILRGEFRRFSAPCAAGFPPDWFQGQTGFSPWPATGHWSGVPDLARDRGDIKYVWELSRFGHAFDLSRAYLCTGEDRYAEGFWVLCESWLAANPPETGVNWRCGQEVSFRILAWVFALYALRESAASTPARVGTLIANLRQHGRHVAAVNWYAVHCVRNNHALSEAVALATLGRLFPFLPEAAAWRRTGERSLAREIRWQVRDDGTYVQQSNNYARLVVQLLAWHLRLGAVNDCEDDPVVVGRAELLLTQLSAQMAGSAGELPNLGSNDGTLLLPWTACYYRDYRPALHALGRCLGQPGLPGAGAWTEEAFWFGLPGRSGAVAERRAEPALQLFPGGGLQVLRGAESLVLFRCGPNTHRPAEADMLHVDYWYRGRNILLDAGTFGYNVAPRVRDYFAGTRSHNTIMVDGRDQMRRGSRFLWHDWVQGELLDSGQSTSELSVTGRHGGYEPVECRRTVHLRGDSLLVVDDVTGGADETSIRLHWLVADFPCTQTTAGLDLVLPDDERLVVRVWCDRPCRQDVVRERPDEPRGVWSPQYGRSEPAWSLAVVARARQVRFVTFVGPATALAALAVADDEPAAAVSAVLDRWRTAFPRTENDPT